MSEEEVTPTPRVRAIAFHLPQFHPIPENDEWWGKGFTEWTNVARAKPNFAGHYQPHLPADTGFYDLRLAEVREQQAALARAHGIYGFCYYFYWFAGKRLLERPVEEMRQSGHPDFPYCFCWANENWTRRWDGADREVLIAQNPEASDDEQLMAALLPHFRDERYIRVDGKPLFIVYRAGVLPDARRSGETWRRICRREGIGDIYLCAAKTYDTEDPTVIGFDATIDFPPHGLHGVPVNGQQDLHNPHFEGNIFDYRQFVLDWLARPDSSYLLHPTVMPAWDNTPRRPDHALTFVNAAPEIYEIWLREVVERVCEQRLADQRMVFINAWNEWAEGTHLEPDQRFGHQYLQATLRAITGSTVSGAPYARFTGRRSESPSRDKS